MTLYDFLSGAVALGFVVCALFFLRFWRRTAEGLFLSFGLAFLLLGIGQSVLALGNIPTEDRGSLYLIRLLAFLLILIGIYRTNRRQRIRRCCRCVAPARRCPASRLPRAIPSGHGAAASARARRRS